MAISNYSFDSIDTLIDFIAARMQDHKDIEVYYPNASMDDIKVIFDIENAIKLNPEVFPCGPKVTEAGLTGTVYTVKRDFINVILETVWNYEMNYVS